MSSLVPTTQELCAEIDSWRKSKPEHQVENAQDAISSFAQKGKVPALSADELDDLIDDALDDNYFEEWFENNTKKSRKEKIPLQDLLFIDKEMVIHACKLITDEHQMKETAEYFKDVLESIRMELV